MKAEAQLFCTLMCLVALLTSAEKGKQAQCPSVVNRERKRGTTYSGLLLSLRQGAHVPHAATWMKPEEFLC